MDLLWGATARDRICGGVGSAEAANPSVRWEGVPWATGWKLTWTQVCSAPLARSRPTLEQLQQSQGFQCDPTLADSIASIALFLRLEGVPPGEKGGPLTLFSRIRNNEYLSGIPMSLFAEYRSVW